MKESSSKAYALNHCAILPLYERPFFLHYLNVNCTNVKDCYWMFYFWPKPLHSFLLHSAPLPHCRRHNYVLPIAESLLMPSLLLLPSFPAPIQILPTHPPMSTQTPMQAGLLQSSGPHMSISPLNCAIITEELTLVFNFFNEIEFPYLMANSWGVGEWERRWCLSWL